MEFFPHEVPEHINISEKYSSAITGWNTAADHAWPITDTDSVLCALEDCAILQRL